MTEIVLYLMLLLVAILFAGTLYLSFGIAKIKKELKRIKFAEDEDV